MTSANTQNPLFAQIMSDLSFVSTSLASSVDYSTQNKKSDVIIPTTDAIYLATVVNNLIPQVQTLSNNYLDELNAVMTEAQKADGYLAQSKVLLSANLKEGQLAIDNMTKEEATKLKLIQFNNYFGEKYRFDVYIMKLIVFLTIIMIVLILLMQRGILTKGLFTIISAIIISIFLIILIGKYLNSLKKSNTNYNEYEWNFDKDAAPTLNSPSDNKSSTDSSQSNATCSSAGPQPSQGAFGSLSSMF